MAAGSQPLAFAELAFGGLLLTSAITGETIGELLTNGLTPKGKERLHRKATEGTVGGVGEGTPRETLPGEGGAPTANPATVPGSGALEPGTAGKPGTTAPPPGKVGATVGKHPSGYAVSEARLKELRYGIERALGYKGELEKQVKNGRLSKGNAEKMFQKSYPWYATWTKELGELLKYLHL